MGGCYNFWFVFVGKPGLDLGVVQTIFGFSACNYDCLSDFTLVMIF